MKKVQKKENRLSERHSIKNEQKNIWYINSMTQNSTFFLLYLLFIRTSVTSFGKMLIFGPVWVFFSSSVCTATFHLCSSSSFSSSLFHSQFESSNSFVVSPGCCRSSRFLHSGTQTSSFFCFQMLMFVWKNTKAWSFLLLVGHLNTQNNIYNDCYVVK